MGTWNVGIFDQDLTLDIRGDFRQLIATGSSTSEATDVVLTVYSSAFQDPQESQAAWLALAETQWDCGRLLPEVKERASKLAADPSALESWPPDLLQARQREIARWVRKLAKEPPPPKRITRRKLRTTELEAGDLLAMRLSTKRWVSFWVVRIHKDRDGQFPVVELLGWTGARPPTVNEALALQPVLKSPANPLFPGLPAHFHVVDLARRNDSAGRYRMIASGFQPNRAITRDAGGTICFLVASNSGTSFTNQIREQLNTYQRQG